MKDPKKKQEYMRRYYQRNIEILKAMSSAWKKANLKKVKAYNRAYYQRRKARLSANA